MYLLWFALCPNMWPILEKFNELLRRMSVRQSVFGHVFVLQLFCDVMLLMCFCFIDRRAKYLAPREEFSAFPFCCCCCPECAFGMSIAFLLPPNTHFPSLFSWDFGQMYPDVACDVGFGRFTYFENKWKNKQNLSPPLFFGWESYILLHIIIIHRIVFYYISFLLSFTLLHIDRVFTVYYFN